jgi:predicted outer membrane repeat protein
MVSSFRDESGSLFFCANAKTVKGGAILFKGLPVLILLIYM